MEQSAQAAERQKQPDYLAARAHFVTEAYVSKVLVKNQVKIEPMLGGIEAEKIFRKKLPSFPSGYPFDFRTHRPAPDDKPITSPPGHLNLCIIGAGMAGLYIAYIFKRLNIPHVTVEILEASDRVGGRAFTHRFPNFPQENHQFYEVGAMRFPDNSVMRRFFDFCHDTHTPTIPYYYVNGSENCPVRFNGRNARKPVAWGEDPFGIASEIGLAGLDPDETLRGVVQPYIDRFNAEGFPAAYAHLMERDGYSVREYLRQIHGFPEEVVQYLEAFGGASNLFDGAFTEYVLEQLQFTTDDWCCMENGVQALADNALREIDPGERLKLNHRVKKVLLEEDVLKVEVAGEGCRAYNTVFCTTSLACASRIDLQNAELNWGQKTAIRSLAYGAATKVGILFRRPWWRTLDPAISRGGFAQTDEPLRICVYPSYNLDDDPNRPAVLLCSYTWSQDALRLGSIIQRDSPRGEEELKELMLKGLAHLHDIDYNTIKADYISHHAHDWYQDPFTSGAYASFGPGQFTHLYPYLTQPAAGGKLIFAGEATSTYHAWILGALTSACRAVLTFLRRHNMMEEIDEMTNLFGPFNDFDTTEIGWQAYLAYDQNIDQNLGQDIVAVPAAP